MSATLTRFKDDDHYTFELWDGVPNQSECLFWSRHYQRCIEWAAEHGYTVVDRT